MSLKKVTQVKADRGFKIWDIAVYAFLAALIAALFAAFVFVRGGTPLESVVITIGFGEEQRTVCAYDFVSDRLDISDPERVEVLSDDDSALKLVFHADGTEYNEILIDKAAVSVRVTNANCPALNCVYTAAITSGSSPPIICATHAMIISSGSVSGSVIW